MSSKKSPTEVLISELRGGNLEGKWPWVYFGIFAALLMLMAKLHGLSE